MKQNTFAIAGLAAGILVGGAMAQDATSTTTSTTSTTTYAAPSYSAGTPVTAPRTGLYTTVTKSNAAADNTVEDYIRRPTLIGNKQFITGSYGVLGDASSHLSFEGNGFNWFGLVRNLSEGRRLGNPSPAELRFGMGSGTAWGGGLIFSFDKETQESAGLETKTVYEGDGFGVFGDLSLGSSDVYGQVALNTGFDGPLTNKNYEEVNPSPGPTQELTNYIVSVMAGWKKDATTERTHASNIEFTYSISQNENNPRPFPITENSANHLIVKYDHGYILRATPDFAVFLGANTFFDYLSLNNEVAPKDQNTVLLSFTPNVAFQKQLGKGFEVFSGVSVNASYFFADNETLAILESTALQTNNASLSAGLRWVKDNFAIEGSVKQYFLLNGPYLIGGPSSIQNPITGESSDGLFATMGLSIGF